MSYYAAGTQGGQSILSPSYEVKSNVTSFTVGNLNSNNALPFPRVTGHQTFYIKYQNAGLIQPICSFSIKGGTNQECAQTKQNSENFRYILADPPPVGCEVIQQDINIHTPNTVYTSRFLVGNITGTDFIILIELSPTTGVDSMFTLTSSGGTTDYPLQITTVYYRTPPNLRTFGSPSSFGAPEIIIRKQVTTFTPDGGVNPLDTFMPLPFNRFNGQQTIKVMQNGVSYNFFQFDIDQGIIGQAGGYLGLSSPLGNARQVVSNPINCTVTNVPIATTGEAIAHEIQFFVTCGERNYYFTFYPNPYTQTPPTIQLRSDSTIWGNIVVVLEVWTRKFLTV